MPRGSKSKYTAKQKRQAQHIEEGEKKRGRGEKRAEQIAWATVNKQDGGGKKRGGGRGRRATSAGRSASSSTSTKSSASKTKTKTRSRRRTGGRRKSA